MDKIRVNYYDGKSSKGYSAELSLLDDIWVIEYLNKDSISEVVKWEIGKVESYQSSDKLIRFKYGEFPQQIIECDAATYEALSKHYPQIKIIDRNFVWILKKGPKMIVGLTLCFIGIMICIYFFVLPPVAELIAGQIPMEYEEKLGQSVYEANMEGLEKNDSLTLLINQFAKEIHFNTNYPIHITVVNVDQLNAYAIPGGEIVVYRKILQEMENEEELAALLAHEVSHVHYRHSLKSISRSLSGYIFLSFLFGDISGLTSVIVENSHSMINLNYSRSLEEEADKKGLEILEANHISQYGFVNLFERMKKEQKDEEYLKYLSSHPQLNERIVYSKGIAQQQKNLIENPALNKTWADIKRLSHSND
ncbi:MAG: M48 family metallopeptidase [Cytophagaceae bacterium]|nr:M48 family metallopeptidase [Cytophagaceae bacterium]